MDIFENLPRAAQLEKLRQEHEEEQDPSADSLPRFGLRRRKVQRTARVPLHWRRVPRNRTPNEPLLDPIHLSPLPLFRTSSELPKRLVMKKFSIASLESVISSQSESRSNSANRWSRVGPTGTAVIIVFEYQSHSIPRPLVIISLIKNLMMSVLLNTLHLNLSADGELASLEAWEFEDVVFWRQRQFYHFSNYS
ncbi:hypothetical protein HD806DRAFT_527474 [Xylariaceae sp. AK1471]|nr:hypothetical protein HD806DRAFT_527474 [Xylariaceae sp. AK1471]